MGHIEKLKFVVPEDANWAQCYIDTSVDEYILDIIKDKKSSLTSSRF